MKKKQDVASYGAGHGVLDGFTLHEAEAMMSWARLRRAERDYDTHRALCQVCDNEDNCPPARAMRINAMALAEAMEHAVWEAWSL